MSGPIWRFSGVEFDERRRELRIRGISADVEVKPLDVLLQLVRNAGEVVTKEELLEAVWPNTEVVDASLATAVSKLRKALGSYGDLVVTVPRVGYRLAATVEQAAVVDVSWPVLKLEAGDFAPARSEWRLARQLHSSPRIEVWLAEHVETHQKRVFKYAHDEVGLMSLKREVTLAKVLERSYSDRLDFVRMLGWSLKEMPYFIESEYAGLNLSDWMAARGGLNHVAIELRLELLAQVAKAVSAAHQVDILHKDLKPGNLMVWELEDGSPRIKVGDFGSAALLATERLGHMGITNLGFGEPNSIVGASVSGTVMYVAPEVLTGQSPTAASDVFSLGTLLYQMAAGDFRKPLAPGWEADVRDQSLREIISLAAAGDPRKRLQSASAFADRLEHLDHYPVAVVAPSRRTSSSWLLPLAGCLLLLVASAGIYLSSKSSPPETQALHTVAVWPLQQIGTDPGLDYLSVALSDEVISLLCDVRGLGVRPLGTWPVVQPPDIQKIGRDLRADSVVMGSFQSAGKTLDVTLKAIEVSTGRILWQDTISSPANSRVAMQVQLALRVRGALGKALGGKGTGSVPEPKNEEAYDLFLRSTAASSDADANRSAIRLLEKAIALEPRYSPTLMALSKRYYIEARYGNGDSSFLERSEKMAAQALAIDPNSVSSAANLIVNRVEKGEVAAAVKQAEDLVRRRPDSVEAQFALSYGYRYAGLLNESAKHCEAGYLLDPRNHTTGLRSCAVVFLLLGDAARTKNYLRLDEGSDFEKALTIELLVREGRKREALVAAMPAGEQWSSYRMLQACAAGTAPAITEGLKSVGDFEGSYFQAAHLAYCGRQEEALRVLKAAVAGGYCSAQSLENDPLLSNLRKHQSFAEIRATARICQDRFLHDTRPQLAGGHD